jgi:hypothetical protein
MEAGRAVFALLFTATALRVEMVVPRYTRNDFAALRDPESLCVLLFGFHKTDS